MKSVQNPIANNADADQVNPNTTPKLVKPPKPPTLAPAPVPPKLNPNERKKPETKPPAPKAGQTPRITTPKETKESEPQRPTSANKSTTSSTSSANPQGQSLAAFRESLSSRQQARQQSRQSLKEKQEKARQEKIEEADRQREQILREMKEKDKEDRRRREKEREEREAKRKEREQAEEAEREAGIMDESRWHTRVITRIFTLLKNKVGETKQRQAIAAYTYTHKIVKRVFPHLVLELRERLTPKPVDYTPAIEFWEMKRLQAGLGYWRVATKEAAVECETRLAGATLHYKSALLKAWKLTRVVLQREKWLADKRNSQKIKEFRIKQYAQKVILAWHEVVREQIKQKMYEQDKTKYMSKVQDWLKEFETQQQLRGNQT